MAAKKKIKMTVYSLSLKAQLIHYFPVHVYQIGIQTVFTSASTVPGPAQDLNSHSICQRQALSVRLMRGRSEQQNNRYILVVRAAMSVLVVAMVVMVVRSGVVVFLIQGRGVGGAKALSLLLGLLQDPAVGQGTEPAQQFPIHLRDV